MATHAVPDVHREAVDGSPSRDRLSRIAAMIRDAEQAMAVGGGHERRSRGARLIPLAARRSRRRRPADNGHTVVELAS